MKAILKAVLPAPVFQFLKHQREWRRMVGSWQKARESAQLRQFKNAPSKLIVFPADPETISGSLGDEAMMSAAVNHYKKLNSSITVAMFCRTEKAEKAVREKGLEPVWLPRNEDVPAEIGKILGDGGYDTLVILGADVMDGYYSPALSASIVAMADIAAKMGISTTMLGFSFNGSPAVELKPFFDKLDQRVKVNLRDEISLQRFSNFTSRSAQLVADSAFMMPPGEVDLSTREWVASQRADGRKVIGFNLHPMLIKSATPDQIEEMSKIAAQALNDVSTSQKVSWLLLPHDYRDDIGISDGLSLRPMLKYLNASTSANVRYFEGEHHASVLKGAAGLMDGVVTGRMHLAIAALGMGVPTLCLTYQDKFEGLYRHFQLPKDLLLSPKIFDEADGLRMAVHNFIEKLSELTEIVQREKPSVMEKSARNFK